ncbi:SUMF1/EgtB/PvdO family nonheme iron enzyme [Candidatus Poribacteria bacterium]|nr:SUMF1/EgtB/PvdO family nonheme iron enzyme [Candidatus Poribacteria bacterium]
MVFIPEGVVIIGTNEKTENSFGNEVDQQSVFVKSFYIDKYEVTNGQYRKFLLETGHRTPKFWENPYLNGDNQPVVGINWEDAETYAKWVGKRLPTDIEWEKAARGISGYIYPWGNTFDSTFGNFDDNGNMDGKLDGFALQTASIGSYPKGVSPFGLHDMAGNVWEWVEGTNDMEFKMPIGLIKDDNLTNGKIYTIRGGSWTNGPDDIRTTVFYIYPAQCSDHSSSVGFRCAKSF